MKQTKVSVVNKLTGEVYDFDLKTPEDVMDAWEMCSEIIKAFERAKDKMKLLVPEFVDEKGTYEANGKMFRFSSIQRMNYDSSAIRDLIDDEDLKSMMFVPKKTFIDNWIKEGIEKGDPTVLEISTPLRESMVPDGPRYNQVRLERVGLGLEKPNEGA